MKRVINPELYPPPPIPEAVPPTVRVLTALLHSRGDQPSLLAALACVHLRRGENDEGIELLVRAVRIAPDNAGFHCNLAVGYMRQSRWDEASATLKRAILLDPTIGLAFYHLGTVEEARGDIDAAIAALETASALEVSAPRAARRIAELCDGLDVVDTAETWYREALRRGDQTPHVLNRLGEFVFLRGLAEYRNGSFEEACRIWGEGFSLYPTAFSGNQNVAKSLYELIRSANETDFTESAVEAFVMASPDMLAERAYPLMLRQYFSLGKIPELYVEQSELPREFERWRAEIAKEEGTVQPYAHYRLGVLLAYEGLMEEAIKELSLSLDFLPPSKHRSLGLVPLLRFLKDLSGLGDEETRAGEDATESDWIKAGFNDPFQLQAWSKSGLSPQTAVLWREAGFSARAAAGWCGSQVPLETAKVWSEAGLKDAVMVRRWIRGGFNVEDAKEWNPLFSHRLEVAIQCREAGLTEPAEAAEWLEVFLFPSEAAVWRKLGFSAPEARSSLESGISDPFLAARQRDELLSE